MDVEKELLALKTKVDEMPGQENKLSMIVFSGELDKQIAAMLIATGAAAALGVQIYIFEMSMDLMGFRKEKMIEYPSLSVCGVATFLANARESAVFPCMGQDDGKRRP